MLAIDRLYARIKFLTQSVFVVCQIRSFPAFHEEWYEIMTRRVLVCGSWKQHSTDMQTLAYVSMSLMLNYFHDLSSCRVCNNRWILLMQQLLVAVQASLKVPAVISLLQTTYKPKKYILRWLMSAVNRKNSQFKTAVEYSSLVCLFWKEATMPTTNMTDKP